MKNGGLDPKRAAFVTVLLDRGPEYRKVSSEVAWGTFVWFVSEPDKIIILRDLAQSERRLTDILAE
jgi:hypothetical protein